MVLGGTRGFKIGNVFLKKLGSGLRTEVSARLAYIVFTLHHLGMVPGMLDVKGFGKLWIFMICWGSEMEKT